MNILIRRKNRRISLWCTP